MVLYMVLIIPLNNISMKYRKYCTILKWYFTEKTCHNKWNPDAWEVLCKTFWFLIRHTAAFSINFLVKEFHPIHPNGSKWQISGRIIFNKNGQRLSVAGLIRNGWEAFRKKNTVINDNNK